MGKTNKEQKPIIELDPDFTRASPRGQRGLSLDELQEEDRTIYNAYLRNGPGDPSFTRR
jgi:hypothetical protein